MFLKIVTVLLFVNFAFVQVYLLEDDCVSGRRALIECNTCSCLQGNLIHCSKYECDPHKGTFELICVEKEIKIDGCILCRCRNGNWQCTEKICDRLKRDIACLNGQTKRDNCKDCVCVNNDWICSEKNCTEKKLTGMKCTQGEEKSVQCNQCKCSYDNTWNCTQRNCNNTQDLKDELKTIPCKSHDQFTINCITCYCNENKIGYNCIEDKLCSNSSTKTNHLKAIGNTQLDLIRKKNS